MWTLNNDPDDTKNDTKKVYRYLLTTQKQAHRHQDRLVVAEEGGARGVTGSLQLAKWGWVKKEGPTVHNRGCIQRPVVDHDGEEYAKKIRV